MRERKLLILCLILLTFSACEKEEDDPFKGEKIRTVKADLINGGGVVLHGDIKNASNVSDHGFLISEDSSRWNSTIGKLSLGKPSKSGAYRYELETRLYPERVYFYKAFIEENSAIFYGKTLSFLSNKTVAPFIGKVAPEKGHLEDYVSIYGKNLGTDPSFATVKFGEVSTFYWYVKGDTLIEAMIPENVTAPNFEIKITVFSNTVTVPYSLHKPEIHGIEPDEVKIGSPFILKGNHFDSVARRNEVYVGETKLLVKGATRKTLEVLIPDELRISKLPFKVKAQLQEVESTFQLPLLSPKILGAPDCAASAEEILITGENFHPNPYWNKVSFNGIEAEVLGGNENEILVRVPRGPFPGGKTNVTVMVADLETTYHKEICITDDWLMISNSLPFHYYGHVGSFSILGKGYVISNSSDFNDSKDYLWEFDPSNFGWTKRNLPFNNSYPGNTAATSDRAYVYTAHSTDNFWEFNPADGQWSKKANFPGPVRGASSMFALSGKVYVGLGRNTEGYYIPYTDFYEYNPVTNSWKRIADAPQNLNESTKANAVVLGDYAYIFGGATNTGMNSLARYNPSSNTWDTLAEMPYAMNYMTGFALNGKIYAATGTAVGGSANYETWIYDPLTNKWEEGPPVGQIGRYRAFSFVINDEVFLGGGEGHFISFQVIEELFKLSR